MTHKTMEQLEAGLGNVLQSPKNLGELRLIVRRPATGAREVLEQGELDLAVGLVGDNWKARGNRRTEDGSAHPDMQLNIINARVIELVAGDRDRWHLAGDQLYIDLDLGGENLPPGSRFELGSALIEVTAQPHTGCRKFVDRFGLDAMKFVNSARGRELNLRGINAKVVEPGKIRIGDVAKRVV